MRLRLTTKFNKDLKRIKDRNLDLELLENVIIKIQNNVPLESKYQLHCLIGNYSGSFECHIKPDWLLIVRIEKDELILLRTGSHSDLF